MLKIRHPVRGAGCDFDPPLHRSRGMLTIPILWLASPAGPRPEASLRLSKAAACWAAQPSDRLAVRC